MKIYFCFIIARNDTDRLCGSSDILSIYVSLLSHLFLIEKFTLTPPFLSPAALRYPPPSAPITCLKVIVSLSLITVTDVCTYILLLL